MENHRCQFLRELHCLVLIRLYHMYTMVLLLKKNLKQYLSQQQVYLTIDRSGYQRSRQNTAT